MKHPKRKTHKNRKHKKVVQRISQPSIFNCKQEQVLRAMYFGFDGMSADVLKPSPVRSTALELYAPQDWVVIGKADERGYRFTAGSNSALAVLGMLPSAVLLHLTRMRLNGQPVVKAQEDKLLALHAAAVQCARDMVFNYTQLERVRGTYRVTGLPILEAYRAHGKPALFA